MATEKTQKGRLEELFSEMGVGFRSDQTTTTVKGGEGYADFYCEFDESGKLKSYGCWL